jgi:spore maturation protein CgeB
MKILIVGADYQWAIENHFVKHFSSLGSTVELFPAQRYFYEYYYKSILTKLICRLGLSKIYDRINEKLVQTVAEFNPSVIFVFKGMEVLPSTLVALKNSGIKLVNYNPDNPFIFSGYGSGNKNVIESLGLYDLHLTYNLEILEKMKSMKLNAEFFPFAFEAGDDKAPGLLETDEVLKPCFLGNPDKSRVDFLNQLAERGVKLDVYGNDWSKNNINPNITAYPPVYGEEMISVLRKYRVQLNLMRIHNLNSHNMRSLEIPGHGGIQLAPRTVEHEMLFEEGKGIFIYNDVDDCVAQINKLLSISFEESFVIRKNAQSSAKSKQTYKKRAELLVELFGKLFTLQIGNLT